MATDTTAPSYWLNWRFLLCAIWIVVTMIAAALIIWRYEGRGSSRGRASGGRRNKGASWATCSRSIHPVWLLGFRIVAFCALLGLILADTIIHGVGIFYFYTEWTFTLVTIYFGLASSLSILGCLKGEPKGDRSIAADAERGPFVAPADADEDAHTAKISFNDSHHDPTPVIASIGEYAFQIIFQMCAGAVMLTDSVYWLVLYSKDDDLTFLIVCMHSVNAVFLLGDTILNSVSFPFFRIAYFALWTCVFVIFQWIIHACVSMSWPYTFLDLSSSYAPLWYLAVGLLHIPCYGIFSLIFKIKQRCLSKQQQQF
ncbi:uncharacterized protein LOC131025302 [Salvia miltiorrhiza]|uniref:uncharacterized protein LOC131025302 n=1 Tax=Salvia miltiorrhiza TaxID=226208 RepID=UPI0025AD13B7|nr:uncharacterized protein LOC131025302 [Salvia miltiorrhiza]XP_057810996.1 uncharacterized protein LOC131025302 [Salvia miltiorrhiza]